MHNIPADEVRVTEHKTKLEGKLDVYEGILSKQKYIAGAVSIYISLPLLRASFEPVARK